MKPEIKNIISIITGIVVWLLTALLCLPLIKMVLGNAISSSFRSGVRIDLLQLSLINLMWIGIASFAGGYCSCWMAASRKIYHAFLMGVIIVIIILNIQLYMHQFHWTDLFTMLMIIPFAVMGGIVRILISNNNLPG